MESMNEAEGREVADPKSESVRDRLARDQEVQRLQAAMYRLPADLREVVLLHYVEGLNKSEIGRLLGVHDSSVGRQIDKALRLLREEMTRTLAQGLRELQPRPAAVVKATAAVSGFAADQHAGAVLH